MKLNLEIINSKRIIKKLKEENLIFLVSQPRAGSTYLQNLLSNNPETNTVSEPWLLLNFVNQLKPELIEAKFDNKIAVDAFKDYLNKYPEIEFNKYHKQFILNLYEPMFNGYNFVIDKTPRYWEILDELIDLFPKSKVIVLIRNPIDVAKSMIKTWNISSLERLNYFKRDLLLAPKALFQFNEKHKENQNVYLLRYEVLLENTKTVIQDLYKWIGVKFIPTVLDTKENTKYKGKYGDPFQNTEREYSIAKKTKNQDLNKVFKKFIIGYGNYLGNDFLNSYGSYSFENYKETRVFKYFLNLGDYGENRIGIKRKLSLRVEKLFINK